MCRIALCPGVPRLYLTRCPRKLVDSQCYELWKKYETYKLLGHLPATGGFEDQSNLVIETIIHCQCLVDTIHRDVEYQKYHRKEQKKIEEEVNKGVGEEKTLESIRKRRKKE